MNIAQTKGRRTSAFVWPAAFTALVLSMAAQPAITPADDAVFNEDVRPSRIACGSTQSPLCCPDDYVCKPAPCVCPVATCCPDTYCPKPCLVLPCPTKRCCADDYCPKPLPSVCRPVLNAWYKCVASPPCNWLKPATCTGQKD